MPRYYHTPGGHSIAPHTDDDSAILLSISDRNPGSLKTLLIDSERDIDACTPTLHKRIIRTFLRKGESS